MTGNNDIFGYRLVDANGRHQGVWPSLEDAQLKKVLGKPEDSAIFACYSDGTEQLVDEEEGENRTDEQQLSVKLLHFYDEFCEFNDCCAFLSDAYAGLSSIEGGLDENSIAGLKRSTGWLKERLLDLKHNLSRIQVSAMRKEGEQNGAM